MWQDSGHGELGEEAAGTRKFGVWEVPANRFTSQVTDFAMGRAHCLFVLETGDLVSCGSNFHGQCGLPQSTAEPGLGPEPELEPEPEPGLDTKVSSVTEGTIQSDPTQEVTATAKVKVDSARQPDSLGGNPIEAGDKLKCATNALARMDADMESKRTCYLSKGMCITALEVRQLEDGTERVRFNDGALLHGWVSRRSCVNIEEHSEWQDILVPDDGVHVLEGSLRIDGAHDEQVNALPNL
eukprot:COSAG02_NODE_6812_length_3348_cov_16.189905_4_plen_240_part_00